MPKLRAEDLRGRDWISASRAARILGVHRNTVLHRAAKGLYRLKNIDDTPYVSRRDVEKEAKKVAPAQKAVA